MLPPVMDEAQHIRHGCSSCEVFVQPLLLKDIAAAERKESITKDLVAAVFGSCPSDGLGRSPHLVHLSGNSYWLHHVLRYLPWSVQTSRKHCELVEGSCTRDTPVTDRCIASQSPIPPAWCTSTRRSDVLEEVRRSQLFCCLEASSLFLSPAQQ